MGMLGRMVVGLGVITFVNTTLAWACTCMDSTAAESVARATAIVVATIDGIAPEEPAGGCGRPTRGVDLRFDALTVTVEEVVSGSAALGERTVRTHVGTSCAIDFAVGERWILEIDDEGRTSLCSATTRMGSDSSEDWLDELRAAAAGDTDG